MEDKKGFIFYLDYEEHLNLLSDAEVGQLIRAMIKYEKNDSEPQLDGIVKMAFSFIKKQLDRDKEKWEDTKKRKSEAGKKGMANRWGKKKSSKSIENSEIDNNDNSVISVITEDNRKKQSITEITDTVTVTVTDNVTVIKEKENKEKEITSDGCVDGLEYSLANDSCVDGLQKIIDFYNNNIGLLTHYGIEVFKDYLKDMNYDVIIYAMQLSVESNARTMKYIKAILNNWSKAGVKNLVEAQEESISHKNKNAEPKEETEKEKIERKIKALEEAVNGENDN